MSKRPGGILAVFQYLDDLTDAMEKMRGQTSFAGHEVFSPTSYHEIEHAADFAPSAVRWFTFVGAMSGTFLGFFMPLMMDWDWNLIVGGKIGGWPSVIAYVIFGFELTILLGGVATIIGMLVMCKVPNPNQRIMDRRFTDDRFGVFVPDAVLDGEQAKLLKDCGAEEIRAIEAM